MNAGDRYVWQPGPDPVFCRVERVHKTCAVLVCRAATGASWTKKQRRPFPSSFRRFDWTIEHLEAAR